MYKAILTAVFIISASSCAAQGYLKEGDPIDKYQGYAVLHPHFAFDTKQFSTVDLELIRADKDSLHAAYYQNVKTESPTIFRLRPGFYYLRSIQAQDGYYTSTLDARYTLFEVRAGQISYPEDWYTQIILRLDSTEGWLTSGSAWISTNLRFGVKRDPNIKNTVGSLFPSIAKQLPIVNTKIDIAQITAQNQSSK